MNINTPVKSEIVQLLEGYALVDSDDYIIAQNIRHKEEIVKRINLHDELVAALKHVNDIMMLPENIEIEIDSLLEKCK